MNMRRITEMGSTDDGGFGRYPYSVNNKPNPYAPAVLLLRGAGGTTMRPVRVAGGETVRAAGAAGVGSVSVSGGFGGAAGAGNGRKPVRIARGSVAGGPMGGNMVGDEELDRAVVAPKQKEEGPSVRDKERKMIETRLAREKQLRDEEAKRALEEREKLKNRVKSASQKLIIPKFQPRRPEEVLKEEERRQKELEEQKKQAREWRKTHKRDPIPPANPTAEPAPVLVVPKKQNEMNFLDGLEGGEITAEASNESGAHKVKKGVMELRQEKAKILDFKIGFKAGQPKTAVFAANSEVYSRWGGYTKPAKPGDFHLPFRPKTKQTSIWEYDLEALEKRKLEDPPNTRKRRRSTQDDADGGAFLDF